MKPLIAGDPAELGGHRLAGRLGQGGQGVVYLGESAAGTPVAIKMLGDGLDDPEARDRFRQEIGYARRVKAFCTAQVLASGEFRGTPYVVSEYVDGPSLATVILERGPLRGAELRRLAIGTLTALAAIHQAGVVHRDFKPGNVLLSRDGPRVIDFGISRALEEREGDGTHLVGTPPYMAPEQFGGGPAGPAADLFAWAGTMVAAATGRPPFGTGELPALIGRILTAEPDLGDLDGELRELAGRCLDKDPAARPTAPQALLTLLGHRDQALRHTGEQRLLAEGQQPAAGRGGWHGRGHHRRGAPPAPRPAPAPARARPRAAADPAHGDDGPHLGDGREDLQDRDHPAREPRRPRLGLLLPRRAQRRRHLRARPRQGGLLLLRQLRGADRLAGRPFRGLPAVHAPDEHRLRVHQAARPRHGPGPRGAYRGQAAHADGPVLVGGRAPGAGHRAPRRQGAAGRGLRGRGPGHGLGQDHRVGECRGRQVPLGLRPRQRAAAGGGRLGTRAGPGRQGAAQLHRGGQADGRRSHRDTVRRGLRHGVPRAAAPDLLLGRADRREEGRGPAGGRRHLQRVAGRASLPVHRARGQEDGRLPGGRRR
uniref:Putative serine/threonine protein kinase n=1 Tax=Nonomuraea gerenzanensis TaxID=93944 RepID=A0A1M4E3L2_9ACTN|nr:putative serine/threonine protein kinase [Nonomuraea gerenzanensis]